MGMSYKHFSGVLIIVLIVACCGVAFASFLRQKYKLCRSYRSRTLRKSISALEDREYALDSIGNSGVCSSVPVESKLTATTLSYLCVV